MDDYHDDNTCEATRYTDDDDWENPDNSRVAPRQHDKKTKHDDNTLKESDEEYLKWYLQQEQQHKLDAEYGE